MTLSEMFPSQYVNGEELKGKSYTLTVQRVKQEEIFDQKKNKKTPKWVVYFEEAKKGCLVGKTQASQIFEAMGTTDSEQWIGKKVEIYPTSVVAFGETHCVPRFRKPSKAQAEALPISFHEEPLEEEDDVQPTVDINNPLGIG